MILPFGKTETLNGLHVFKWNGYRYSYIYYHLDEEKIIHASFSVAKDSSLLALLVNIMEPKIIE